MRTGAGWRTVLAAGLLLAGFVSAQEPEAPAESRLTMEETGRLLTAGRAACEDGLYPLAERRLQEVLDAAPDRRRQAEAALWLARVQLARGESASALAMLDKYQSFSRDAVLLSEYALTRAQVLEAQQRLPEALKTLDPFMAEYEGEAAAPVALQMRARLAAGQADWDEVRRTCDQLESKWPDVPETPAAWMDAGTALADAGESDAAMDLLTRLEAMEVSSVWEERASLKIAEIQLGLGRRDEAMKRLRHLAAATNLLAETRARGFQMVAQTLGSESNFPAALEMIDWGIAGAADPAQRLESQGVKARLLLQAGRIQEGVDLMRSVAAQVPDETLAARLQLGLAGGLARMEKWEEAAAEYQAWLDAFEGKSGTAEALAGCGWALWSSGHPEEAASMYLRAVGAESDPARRQSLRLRLAEAQFGARQYSQAKETWQQVLEDLKPGDEAAARIRFQLAETELALGETEAGEIRLLELSRDGLKSPYSRKALMRLGALYEERGALETAMEQYGILIQACPEPEACAEALLARGLIRYRMGSFQAALDDLNRIRDEFPDSGPAAQAMFMRGWCAYLLGRDEEALEICESFLETYPDSGFAPDVRFWLGEHAFNLGQYEQAESRFASVAADHPDSPRAADALYWAGRAATARRAYLEANEHYNTLMSLYPESPRLAGTLLAQGDVLSELGQFAAAILAFDEVIVRFPQAPEAMMAWGRKGDCQYTLGQEDPARYEEALLSYRMLLDFAGAPVDLRLQAEYKIGRCLEKIGRSTAALDRYMDAVYSFLQESRPPAEANVWFTRAAFAAASLQERAGQWKEAAMIYKRVADSGVAAADEARDRMERIRKEHWVLF